MRGIKSEEQFGDLFIDSPSISSFFSKTNNIFYVRELSTSLGVPDYVLLTDSDYQKLTAFASRYSNIQLTSKYSAVISYVAKSEYVMTQEISDFFHKKETQMKRTLRELEDWGVIEFDGTNRKGVFINPQFQFPELKTLAVELKLSSWKKALWQAIRNSGQFVSSCVVMPSDKLNLLNKNQTLFEANKIGTAVLDVDSLSLTQINDNIENKMPQSRYYMEAIGSLMKNIERFEQITY